MDTLAAGTFATHDVLGRRLSKAAAARPDPQHPRDHYRAIDTFLASASRHQGAVLEILVPAVRERVPDGNERAEDFVHQDKELERALAQLKAKLYASSYAVRRAWPSIWDDVRQEFEATWRLERGLVEQLDRHRLDDGSDWGARMYHAELRAPTRPHPFLPHSGLRGRIARRFALRVDQFWDTVEGRMVPEPVHTHDRTHDGRLAQYLLADPHMHED